MKRNLSTLTKRLEDLRLNRMKLNSIVHQTNDDLHRNKESIINVKNQLADLVGEDTAKKLVDIIGIGF